jgi:hypothetical protein
MIIIAHRGIISKNHPENSILAFKECFNMNTPFEVDIQENNKGVLVCCHDKGDIPCAPLFSSIIPLLVNNCILDIKEGVSINLLKKELEGVENITLNIQFNESTSPKIYGHNIGYLVENREFTLNYDFFTFSRDSITPEIISYLHNNCIKIFIYDVKDESELESLSNVSGIITSNPEKIIIKPLNLPEHLGLYDSQDVGCGIYTKQSYDKGDTIFDYEEEEWPKRDGMSLSHIFLGNIVIGVYEHSDKDKTGRHTFTNFDNLINHSCEPNIRYDEENKCAIALNPIKEGYELTVDYNGLNYNKQDFKPFTCICGKKIKGFSSLSKKIKQKLLDEEKVGEWVLTKI